MSGFKITQRAETIHDAYTRDRTGFIVKTPMTPDMIIGDRKNCTLSIGTSEQGTPLCFVVQTFEVERRGRIKKVELLIGSGIVDPNSPVANFRETPHEAHLIRLSLEGMDKRSLTMEDAGLLTPPPGTQEDQRVVDLRRRLVEASSFRRRTDFEHIDPYTTTWIYPPKEAEQRFKVPKTKKNPAGEIIQKIDQVTELIRKIAIRGYLLPEELAG